MSDLACMLLSNMTKLDSAARDLVALHVPFRFVDADSTAASAPGNADEAAPPEPKKQKVETSEFELPALDLLLEVFLKGDDKKYNPNATYDFLASVFANVSLVR